jgi:hypothetical protein
MEEEKNENGSNLGQWIKDNLRIIVSVIIVIAIAGGIYSYSKRTQPPVGTEEKVATEESSDTTKSTVAGDETQVSAPTGTSSETKVSQEQEPTVTAPESKETEKSFIETAARGNGKTHLARRALADYLEKNPDSSLNSEQKIYIEDYLRKHVGFKGSVHVGTSVEFGKDLVSQAIEQSKKLNDKQIKNLHKYVVMVPSLS